MTSREEPLFPDELNLLLCPCCRDAVRESLALSLSLQRCAMFASDLRIRQRVIKCNRLVALGAHTGILGDGGMRVAAGNNLEGARDAKLKKA
jgi:hypothetical protein